MNLHARLRFRLLPAYIGAAHSGMDRLILDAGCGNGVLSYVAYQKGNRVVGVSLKRDEVGKCKALFNEYLAIPERRLDFRVHNLHELEALRADVAPQGFDEIICSEVLEHIEDDRGMLAGFRDALKTGGCLHLCCPNAEHPDNKRKELDAHEDGGHVRAGYTFEDYDALLRPLGFEVAARRGVGGPVRQYFNRRSISTQERLGAWAGMPWVLGGWVLLWLDTSEPRVPYSVYVKAVKREMDRPSR